MIRSNTLQIVTTIAHHPAGRELHLRNLKWALANIPHKILVFTFDGYGFEPLFGERYVTVPGDVASFYDFHGGFLARILKESRADCILAMQQDILFTRPVASVSASEIVMQSPLPEGGRFSVLGADGKLKYPRIWEGGLFFPTEFLRRACLAGVSMGFDYQWAPRQSLPDLFFRPKGGGVVPACDWLKNPPTDETVGDKFTDLTLYAATVRHPYRIDPELHVHFSGPEHTHHHHPRCYQDAEILLDLAMYGCHRVSNLSVHNTAFLFLMANVLRPGPVAAKVLTFHKDAVVYPGFRDDVERVAVTYKEWMSPSQARAFEWALQVIRQTRQASEESPHPGT